MPIAITNKFIKLSALLTVLALSACDSDDKNTAPTIEGTAFVSVDENSTEVGQYQAIDSDGNNISFQIEGDDSDLFTIDDNGKLAFYNTPDFDAGETGPYNITIVATDDHKSPLSTEYNVKISVGDILDTPATAVLQTVAPGYNNGSEVVYIDGYQQTISSGYYYQNESDYTVATYKDSVYHIGRYYLDIISKYNAQEPDTQVWQFNTLDSLQNTQNPYTLVHASDDKAYLIRYGSDKIWIVNPNAELELDFKIGELDLSDYVSDTTRIGTPSPSSGIIVDGKLFVVMQRLDENFQSVNDVYVAVFDTVTDQEIETLANDTDAVKGIPLQGKNPVENSLTSFNNMVYVTTKNAWGATDSSLSRIETIDANDYSVNQLIAASDINIGLNTYIKSTLVVSEESGYFTAGKDTSSTPYSVEALYHFNPKTGDVLENNIANTGSESISNITLDEANYLWVSISDDQNSGIDIIDTSTNTKVGSRIETNFYAKQVSFLTD